MRRSRVAVAVALAAAVLVGAASSAHALSALTTDLTATAAQYGQSTVEQQSPGGGGPGTTLGPPGDQASVPEDEDLGGDTPDGVPDRDGAIVTRRLAGAAIAQRPRQLAVGGGQGLPFTGLTAIPLLLIGIVLLAAGLALQRRVRRAQALRYY